MPSRRLINASLAQVRVSLSLFGESLAVLPVPFEPRLWSWSGRYR
jgi:hypothetical protein